MKTHTVKQLPKLLLLAVLACIVFECSDGEKAVDPYGEYLTWAFTGKVIDGYDGKSLPGVIITYVNSDGVTSYETTDGSGMFGIQRLPAGQRSFAFFRDTTGIGGCLYTRKELLIASGIQSNDSLVIPIGVSRVVELFPLTGSLTGIIHRRFQSKGQSVPVGGVGVTAEFSTIKDEFLSPSIFAQKSDSTGVFIFTGLPAADNMRVKVLNITVDGITYRANYFSTPEIVSNDTVAMGTIYMQPVDLQNALLRFLYSNVYDFLKSNSINGLPVDAKIILVANKEIASAVTMIREGSTNGKILLTEQVISGDTLFVIPQAKLKSGERYYLYGTATAKTGESYSVGQSSYDDYIRFVAGSQEISIAASNVLSGSGIGLSNVPIGISPYFVLRMTPKPGTVTVNFVGGGSPNVQVRISGDTVFTDPVTNFLYSSSVATRINGVDTSGSLIDIYLTDDQRFITEEALFSVNSNTWDANGNPVTEFPLNDTMWVQYSHALDTNPALIEWSNPGTDVSLYGSGTETNAEAWIHDDTLFVLPKQQAYINYGDEVGFKVRVATPLGLKSSTENFAVVIEEKEVLVTWTNTIDSLGNPRDDFGLMEQVIVVSNEPVQKVNNVSSFNGKNPPSGITPSCFTIKEDTIIFTPPIAMNGNTGYGMDFDLTLVNGMKITDALGVSWRTKESVIVNSVNNKSQGKYRMFSVQGASLSVTFSNAIDTSSQAPIRFTVHALDKNDDEYAAMTTWNASLTTATVHFLDTLPAADADANPAYTDQAVNTRAIKSVTFDLSTVDGAYVSNLGLKTGDIEIHTEPGLCVIGSNIVQNHTPGAVVQKEEQALQTLSSESNLTVTFNRQLDTAAIKTDISGTYFSILDPNGFKYPYTISFSDNGRTAVLNPIYKLNSNTKYYLRLYAIPGAGIKNAKAVNKHSGRYSGSADNNTLLEKTFGVIGPNISQLTTALLPDDNTVPLVLGDRFGFSAGFRYDKVVGTANAGSDSSLILRIQEAAWNSSHNDSVNGYQIEVRRTDKAGNITTWYFGETTVPTLTYSAMKTGINKAFLNITGENFYPVIATKDLDEGGTFYQNGLSLFNDSARIGFRVRPYVSTGNPLNNYVGVWSGAIDLADNVAPCDSDFVTSLLCDSLPMGGVRVTSYVPWVNPSSLPFPNGYIEIQFPEDMTVTGTVPVVSVYYGTFGGAIPVTPVTVGTSASGWLDARTYRCFITVPPGDYTHAGDGTGCYYNVSVAGCKDASGNVIRTYGTNGALASTNVDMVNAIDQVPGSASVVRGFRLSVNIVE